MNTIKRFLQITVIIVFLSLATAGLFVVCGTSKASAAPERQPVRYYTSIKIEQGDTLWEIASKYKLETESTQDYIDEVIAMNQLSSDRITSGKSLMVYYYVYPEGEINQVGMQGE